MSIQASTPVSTTAVILTGTGTAGVTLYAAVMRDVPTYLSIVGSILGILWFALQIYESVTFQQYVLRRGPKLD